MPRRVGGAAAARRRHGRRLTTRGWTVDEACAQFAEAGLPVDPARFRMVIRALRLEPVGETSRDGRGRGQALYDIATMQRLHAALAPWLRVPDKV